MTNKLLLTLLLLFILVPTAQAYSPPPGGNIILLSRPRQAKITIKLPPKLIMTPAKLTFPQSGVVYTFNGEKFEPENGLYLDHKVITTELGSGAGTYYVITIKDFKIDEKRPPDINDFRLTFQPTVSNNDIKSVESYLRNPLNFVPTARLSGPGCDTSGGKKSHICLETSTTVTVPGKNLPVNPLFQTIPIKGIFVGGNSAALGGTLANFIQSGNALAVGGTITNIDGGQTIAGYSTSNDFPSSPIHWENIGAQLTAQFNIQKSINKIVAYVYNANRWNLNSSDDGTPSNQASNSFSTPPEGKLWNIYVDRVASRGTYLFGPNHGDIRMNGSGTISIRSKNDNEPMPVEIQGNILCEPGTRFALVTEGDIKFTTPPNQKMLIECGSFTSLKGSITFGTGNVKEGKIKGIFVAKGNIVLPDSNALTSVFSIDPDTVITNNPPVLLRELLKIVFGSSS